jgi:secreted trypsin-like serine protease
MFRFVLLVALAIQGTLACRCGKSASLGRIIGGSRAAQGAHPWQVRLTMNMGRGSALCGGSVISPNYILTAAHCVVNQGRVMSASQVSVLAGTVGGWSGPSGQKRNAAEIIVHSSYGDLVGTRDNQHDIALIRMDRPLSLDSHTAAVCLNRQRSSVDENSPVWISGFGQDANGQTQQQLKEAQVMIQDGGFCTRAWRGIYDDSRQVCAISRSNSVCRGDSGGPLTQKINGRYEQIGLVSFGSADMCLNTRMPPVFTRVSNYVNWIERNMRESTCN